MQELIKITERNGQQVVSARELHLFLEVETRFNDWIIRMFEYGFIENVDYQVLLKNEYNPNGGRPQTDYALTLDTAKEISMLQRTEKGKQARRYFIECEKVAKNKISHTIPQSYSEALKLAYEQSVKIEEQQKLLKEQAPKVLFTEAVMGSQSSCLIGELAKMITQNGYEIGLNRMFEWLRCEGYLGKHGERKNIPNQQYIEQGLFELKKGVRTGNSGELHTTVTTKVTGKGQVYFINKFLKSREMLQK